MTHLYKGAVGKLRIEKSIYQYFLYDTTRANACSFLLAFVQMFSVWYPKEASLKNTPSNFSFREFLMTTFPTLTPLFPLPLNIKWHLSGFNFTLLSFNHCEEVWKCILNFGWLLPHFHLLCRVCIIICVARKISMV